MSGLTAGRTGMRVVVLPAIRPDGVRGSVDPMSRRVRIGGRGPMVAICGCGTRTYLSDLPRFGSR